MRLANLAGNVKCLTHEVKAKDACCVDDKSDVNWKNISAVIQPYIHSHTETS